LPILQAPTGPEPVSPWLGATYSERQGAFLQEPCLPFGVDPIHSHADTYDQGDPQLGGALHMAFYQLCGSFLLPVWHLKYKLVMDLQDHARHKSPLLQGPCDADHRDLDQVTRIARALKERGLVSRMILQVH